MMPKAHALGFSTFVRNEIHCLPGLLDDIKGKFDDVVVVDTGSNDGTWEMLRDRERRGDLRPYRIPIPFDAKHFHFGYVRSMAAHLSHTDWVMMLDADERMNPNELDKIRDTVIRAHAAGVRCLLFPRCNYYDAPPGAKFDHKTYPDLQARCIYNDGTLWWRRPVHEVVLRGPERMTPPVWTTDLHIHHFHIHFRAAKKDDGAFNQVYADLAKSDPEWADTY